jgi:uncharacterized protein YdeI (YjbR/CyaY-like superfamily)
MAAPELPVLELASRDAWEAWLDEHHDASPGVWIRFAKKDSGITSIVYAEALEVALCFGWIDGQVAKDPDTATWYRQRFTPRTKRSRWSKINVQSAERLIAQGRMRPSGLAAVEAAKADGRWEAAYASAKSSTVPADLQRELDADPKAAAFFATLSSQNRYAILYRLQDAKRPETRARRLATFMEMLREGRTLH